MQLAKFWRAGITILTILIIFGTAAGQIRDKTTRLSLPLLTIELVASYNAGVQNTSGDVSEFFAFKNYGASIGFGGQFNWKLAVDRKGKIRPYLTIGYTQFQNDDDKYAYIDSNTITGGYPLDPSKSRGGLSQYQKIRGKSDLFIRAGYAGLGIEYAWPEVIKSRRLIPFIGLDLTINVLWGLYRQQPDSTFPGQSGRGQQISFTIKPGVRMGIGINSGVQYRLAEAFGLGAGIHYRWANMIGKSSKRTMDAHIDPNDENKMELLDDGDRTVNPLLKDTRNIGYFEIYFGFVFYIVK